MKNCEQCGLRSMIKKPRDGKVFYECACGHTVAGGDGDRLIAEHVIVRAEQAEKYESLLSAAPFGRVMNRVAIECPQCKLPYLVQSRLGQEETIVYTCECGFKHTGPISS